MNVPPSEVPPKKALAGRQSAWHPSIFFNPLRLSETIANNPSLSPILLWALISWWLHEPQWVIRLGVRLKDSHIYAVPPFLQGLVFHALPWMLCFALVALGTHLLERRMKKEKEPKLSLEARWLSIAALWSLPLTLIAFVRIIVETFGITPDPLDAPLDALANYPVGLSLKLTSYTAGVAGVLWIAIKILPRLLDEPQATFRALRSWQMVLIIVSGLVAAAINVERNWEKVRPLQTADQAPEFNLKSLDGTKRVTREQWTELGGLTLIDFWATWCEPCKIAMPKVEALHEKYHDKGVRILSVNIENGDEEVVRQFLTNHPMPFEVWIDDDRMAARYDVSLYPTFVLLEGSNVVGIFEGLPGLTGAMRQVEAWVATTNP